MSASKKRYRAIDLYSGIGGWSLGLEMAGIDVVGSYEWWAPANITNQKNNKHLATAIDIRELPLKALPKDVDIVVGSPPCTQFSFANRGGNGDIEDGLKDIAKFLEVVDYVKPKYWAMENVPRVLGIIEAEMQEGGRLARFAHLKPQMEVCDTSDWGVPQRRQRCIAGNFDFALLNSYRAHTPKKTLGDVVGGLDQDSVVDPSYGIELDREQLIDHEIEECLSLEEERINRESKTFHPVYNNMAFPDLLNRPARTVTATCTRVSRESIVIESPEFKGKFRRLTVRERGCLQGFPVTYQFFGQSHSQKLKMIGNAVPPIFTFYIAQAMLQVQPEGLRTLQDGIENFNPTSDRPQKTQPDKVGESYSANRRFRSAIPSLRFKSGVRFELVNAFDDGDPSWRINFFFGNSKDITQINLDSSLSKKLKNIQNLKKVCATAKDAVQEVTRILKTTDAQQLQTIWIHQAVDSYHPYEIVDVIGKAVEAVIQRIKAEEVDAGNLISGLVTNFGGTTGTKKLLTHADAVLAGCLVGSMVNEYLDSESFKTGG